MATGTLLTATHCASLWLLIATAPARAQSLPRVDQTEACEILVAGGGLAGAATAYESLLAGRTVCLTEITDWVGGQISAQGTSALDEAKKQRSLAYFPKGYNELRDRIQKRYGTRNPGDCWVSVSCFLPKDAHAELWSQLKAAEKKGRGKLKWFPNTVVKDLQIGVDGKLIEGAIAIQHRPAPGQSLNAKPLSQTLEDAYRYENSSQFTKTILKFEPKPMRRRDAKGQTVDVRDWYVVDTTETGELIAIADVPYRLGLDPRSYLNPSSASTTGDPYCTQGFTYTFALERTAEPQPQPKPAFYDRYAAYYGYDKNPNLSSFDAVFTYRRIWAPGGSARKARTPKFNVGLPQPGDISMQNWVWGNDYRPGTASDNLVYSRDQLQQSGQLSPGGWLGGLRTVTLQAGEEQSLGFYHWLTSGTTNSQGDAQLKQPAPNHRLLQGQNSPMGTLHGLSKYPYIREGRRIIGRPSYAHKSGFTISELDISRQDFRADFYKENLSAQTYRTLWNALAGLEATAAVGGKLDPNLIKRRSRSTIYPDAVGIAQYAIDFHPCMAESPSEKPGNLERPGARQGQGQSYPAQIPLRAMIPQKIDNLLVAGKSIATSHIAAAAYRVHSFEWSSGAAAGTAIALALETGIRPYQLVDDFPRDEPLLRQLRDRLKANGNPTTFPDTTIFNEDWEAWNVW
ncbi:MAG: FAD-dependent oxidoreductase [Synechococcales cyanobacterium CRU_2_2]|nr:FAD-dependent oxidoreductase [Synechococcales cyanobacterium CRU_2_2]